MPVGGTEKVSEIEVDGSTAPRGRRPVVVFALLDRIFRYRFGIVAGLVASIPLLRAVWQERALGWVPTGDGAVIASRAVDVLGSDTPLIGQASMASDAASVHSPGPALYWLLAVPARIGPFWLQPATMALVGILVAVGACVIAEHLAGRWASAVTGLALVLVIRSVDAVNLVRPLNPYTGLTLLIGTWFLAWLAASGRRAAYPVLIVVGSATAHMHLTYLVPVTVAVAIATVALFGSPLLARIRTGETGSERSLRWFVAGVAAAGVMWLLPIWQQLTSKPGNIGAILMATDDDTPRRGFGKAVGVVAHSIGWRPRFLYTEAFGRWPKWMLGPSTLRSVTAWIVIGIAVVVAADAARRRDRVVVAGLTVATGAIVSLFIGYSVMPASGPGVLTTFYTMRWIAPAGMLVWLVMVIGAVRAATQRSERFGAFVDRTRARIANPLPRVVVGLAAIVGLVGAVPYGHESWGHRPARALGDAAVRVVESGERHLVDGDRSRSGLSLTPAVVYRLRRAGVSVTMSPHLHNWVDPLGDSYGPSGRPCDGRIIVREVGDRAADPGRVAVVDASRDGTTDGPVVELVHEPPQPDDSC